jgi:hypothetical protein
MRELVTQLQTIASEAAETTAQMEGMHGNLQLAAGAANALAGGLSAAQGPAWALLGQMQGIASAAWAAAQNWSAARAVANTPAAMGPAGAPIGAIPVAGPDDGVAPGRPAARPVDIDFGYTPAAGGGSADGGGGTTPQEPEYWDDLIAKVREGEQAFEDYNQTVERGANAMADFFTSIVDGSKSAKDAVAELLLQLAQVQFQRAILGMVAGGGTMGSIAGALGGALAVPSFAGGGYTGGGARVGGMDGQGGFPAMLHPNETVIDHTKGGAGVGGQVSVVVRMDGGNLVPVIESVSGQVSAKVMASYDRQLSGRVRSINADPRKR